MKSVLIALVGSLVLCAGENLNGIYLGECALDAPCQWAVQIEYDGTVVVRKGMTVPMHDPSGRQVVIKRVEVR